MGQQSGLREGTGRVQSDIDYTVIIMQRCHMRLFTESITYCNSNDGCVVSAISHILDQRSAAYIEAHILHTTVLPANKTLHLSIVHYFSVNSS